MEKNLKMSFTKEEQKEIILGIASYKKTKTYKKAVNHFQKKCKELSLKGYIIDGDSKYWFCDKKEKWSMKMTIIYYDASIFMGDLLKNLGIKVNL